LKPNLIFILKFTFFIKYFYIIY